MSQSKSYQCLSKYKFVCCLHGDASIDFIDQIKRNHSQISSIMVFFDENLENKNLLKYCIDNKIIYSTSNININIKKVDEFKPHFLLSAYYRTIISEEILEKVLIKSINYHPSILPKHRGCFSSAWEIISGDDLAGYTFHVMNQKIDDGDIIIQEMLPLVSTYTSYDLYNIKHSMAVASIKDVFSYMINGGKGYIQSKNQKSYHRRELPYDGVIDPAKHTFSFAKKLVRAYIFKGKPPVNIKLGKEIAPLNSISELNEYRSLFK